MLRATLPQASALRATTPAHQHARLAVLHALVERRRAALKRAVERHTVAQVRAQEASAVDGGGDLVSTDEATDEIAAYTHALRLQHDARIASEERRLASTLYDYATSELKSAETERTQRACREPSAADERTDAARRASPLRPRAPSSASVVDSLAPAQASPRVSMARASDKDLDAAASTMCAHTRGSTLDPRETRRSASGESATHRTPSRTSGASCATSPVPASPARGDAENAQRTTRLVRSRRVRARKRSRKRSRTLASDASTSNHDGGHGGAVGADDSPRPHAKRPRTTVAERSPSGSGGDDDTETDDDDCATPPEEQDQPGPIPQNEVKAGLKCEVLRVGPRRDPNRSDRAIDDQTGVGVFVNARVLSVSRETGLATVKMSDVRHHTGSDNAATECDVPCVYPRRPPSSKTIRYANQHAYGAVVETLWDNYTDDASGKYARWYRSVVVGRYCSVCNGESAPRCMMVRHGAKCRTRSCGRYAYGYIVSVDDRERARVVPSRVRTATDISREPTDRQPSRFYATPPRSLEWHPPEPSRCLRDDAA